MMQHLLNSQKAAAQQASQSRASTRHGIVTSYDPNAYAIKVTLQPDNVVTGWIPLKSAWVGNSWGLFCPPSIGDAVEVDFQEDDGGVGSAGQQHDQRPDIGDGEGYRGHTGGGDGWWDHDGDRHRCRVD